MIDPERFFENMFRAGVRFAAGVPDSLLGEACTWLADALPPDRHVIAANEGTAVALAVGHHLGTDRVPLVYLQNSGIGNAVNPLLSLAHPEVYAVPIAVLIGWRGEPDVPDEPQHRAQGRLTPALLDVLEVPFRIVDGASEAATLDAASWVVAEARKRSGPAALVIRRGVFRAARRTREASPERALPLAREQAIERIVAALGPDTFVVATTGMAGRELHEIRRRSGQNGAHDFLTVGSMGHASQIALGIALARPDARVICLDGDGAALMHLGGLATIATSAPVGLVHVVLNNGAHDSVGGQPTAGFAVRLTDVARACGYRTVVQVAHDAASLDDALRDLRRAPGPAFLEVRVALGARPDLGRPSGAPVDNKQRFMRALAGEDPA